MKLIKDGRIIRARREPKLAMAKTGHALTNSCELYPTASSAAEMAPVHVGIGGQEDDR